MLEVLGRILINSVDTQLAQREGCVSVTVKVVEKRALRGILFQKPASCF